MTTSSDGPVGPVEELEVVLVAHHTLVGEAVATALSSRGLRVTPQAEGGGREPAQLGRLAELGAAVGLVVRDLGDPVQLHDTVRLIDAVPLRWVVLTSCRDASRWGAVVEAGAAGVMAMSSGIVDVERSLRAVAAGGPGMPSSRRAWVVAAWRALDERDRRMVVRMGQLTPREMTVLGLLAGGLPVARIAERLQVSEVSVRGSVRSLTGRLEVHSQLAAVAAYHQVVRRRDDVEPPSTAGPQPR